MDGWEWHPTYTVYSQRSKCQRPYSVQASCDSCPQLYCTTDSFFILDQHMMNSHAHESTGATLFGPDTRRWLAWWFDAVALLHVEHIAEHNARSKAEYE